jgi:hypothetical protein
MSEPKQNYFRIIIPPPMTLFLCGEQPYGYGFKNNKICSAG